LTQYRIRTPSQFSKILQAFASTLALLYPQVTTWECQKLVFLNVYTFYIQNIFLGEDIRRQLPKESAEFDDINGKWKMIMTHLNKVKNVYRGTHQPGVSTCHLSARYICIHRSQVYALSIATGLCYRLLGLIIIFIHHLTTLQQNACRIQGK